MNQYERDWSNADLVVRDALREHEVRNMLTGFIRKVVLPDDHYNTNNYRELIRNLDEFLSFEVVFLGDQIVMFGGMRNAGRFQDDTARIYDRHYVNPEFRRGDYTINSEFHKKDERSSLATRVMMPKFIETARQHDLGGVFYSIQTPRKRRAMKWFVKRQQKLGYDFQILDGVYMTCPPGSHDNPLCWQNIAELKLKPDFVFDNPKISCDEWYERFE